MMNKTISVIVPIYNVRDYLGKCINSIINQTYSNLDIILIDDCSSDGSGDICDKYALKDNRIRVIHNNINLGVSASRNIGIDLSKGDCISFIDGDDYIDFDMYESMISHLNDETDIVSCGFNNLFPKTGLTRDYVSYKQHTPTYYSSSEAMLEFLSLKAISLSCCDKLFAKRLFASIRFPVGKRCEDIIVMYELLKKSRGLFNIGLAKYNYIFRADSFSRSDFSKDKMNYCYMAREIYKNVKKELPEFKDYAHFFYLDSMAVLLEEIRKMQRDKFLGEKIKLEALLICNFIKMVKNKKIDKWHKEFYSMLMLGI